MVVAILRAEIKKPNEGQELRGIVAVRELCFAYFLCPIQLNICVKAGADWLT